MDGEEDTIPEFTEGSLRSNYKKLIVLINRNN